MAHKALQETPAWELLKELAKHDSDDSARQLAQLIRKEEAAKKQLTALVGYRADYQGRLANASRDGIGGEGLRNFRVFLDNLEVAIDQQTHVIAALHAEVGVARSAWEKDQRRVDSYHALDSRHADAVQRVAKRREQALQDEMATRAYFRRLAGDD